MKVIFDACTKTAVWYENISDLYCWQAMGAANTTVVCCLFFFAYFFF